MAKKPNYGHERAQRARIKKDKKQEKLQRRQDESDRRKSPDDAAPDTAPEGEAETE